MDSSKEIIEAQLAAYVDGELTDAERAEIERHLTANPQHRTLIRELMGHRDLLRELPRASAPADLNQEFSGQLERSALLDAGEESVAVAGRIHRWPQIAAVAAVVFLALGLGIVVYYVLPSSNDPATNSNLAINDPIGKDKQTKYSKNNFNALKDALTESKLQSKEPGFREKGLEGQAAEDALRQPPKSPLNSDQLANNQSGGNGWSIEKANIPNVLDGRGYVPAREIESLRKRLNMDAQAQGGPVGLYLLVSADDAEAANSRLTTYFEKNGITYMRADELQAARGLDRSVVASVPSRGVNESTSAGINSAAGNRTAGEEGGRPSVNQNAKDTDADPAAARPTERFGMGGGAGGGGAAGKAVTAEQAPRAALPAAPGAATSATLKQNDVPAKLQDKGKWSEDLQREELARNRKISEREASSEAVKIAVARPQDAVAAGAAAPTPAPVLKSIPETAVKEAIDGAPSRLAEGRGQQPNSAAGAVLGRPTFGGGAADKPDLDVYYGRDEARKGAAEGDFFAGRPVLVARMNRRQAMALGEALSRQEGVRADLQDVSGATLANGATTTPLGMGTFADNQSKKLKGADGTTEGLTLDQKAAPGAAITAKPGALTPSYANTEQAKLDARPTPGPATAPSLTPTMNLAAAKPPVAPAPAMPEAVDGVAELQRRAAEAAGGGAFTRDGAKPEESPAPRRDAESGKRSLQGIAPAREEKAELKKASDPLDEAVDVYIVVRPAQVQAAPAKGQDEKK